MKRKGEHRPKRQTSGRRSGGLVAVHYWRGDGATASGGATQATTGGAGRAGKNRGVLRRDAVGQPGPGVPRRSHCDVARVGGLRGTHLLVVLLLLWGRSHQENPNGEPARATAHLEEERRSFFWGGKQNRTKMKMMRKGAKRQVLSSSLLGVIGQDRRGREKGGAGVSKAQVTWQPGQDWGHRHWIVANFPMHQLFLPPEYLTANPPIFL